MLGAESTMWSTASISVESSGFTPRAFIATITVFSFPIAFGLRETVVGNEEFNDFLFVGFVTAGEFSFLERKRELA